MNNKNEINATEIIQNKLDQVQTNLSHKDYFTHYIYETLDSFAFRYFDEPKLPEKISSNVMRVVAVENGIKEAIKNKNPQLRAGITELVKRVSKKEGPTLLREIRVSLEWMTEHAGNCEVVARISFGFPEHDFAKGTFVEKLIKFKYVDEIHFRNTLAKNLEVICELF